MSGKNYFILDAEERRGEPISENQMRDRMNDHSKPKVVVYEEDKAKGQT